MTPSQDVVSSHALVGRGTTNNVNDDGYPPAVLKFAPSLISKF